MDKLRQTGSENALHETNTAARGSRVIRFDGSAFTWADVPTQLYKPEEGGWAGIVRQVIFGHREAMGFHGRYFEIAAGGYSSLERHEHPHAVVVVRGQGRALVGEAVHELGFLDALYVAPDEPHRFINDGSDPFGFLCFVDAQRDRPRPVDGEALQKLLSNPETKGAAGRDEPNLTRADS